MAEPLEHFTALYANSRDPWNYETSDYERRKYQATLDALTRPRYASAIEAGCSIGVLSARLAERCTGLIALDFSALAVAQATERLRGFPGARATCAALPDEWPQGCYDLIMLSELVYYLNHEGIVSLAMLVARDAAWSGECVLVHYQGDTQTEIGADRARDIFCAALANHRTLSVTDHATTGEYSHRTILLDRRD